MVGGWLLSLSLYLATVREDRQANDEDIFVGAFSAKPCLNRQGNLTYKSDAHAEPFWQQRKHVAARRPPVALLVATNPWELPR